MRVYNTRMNISTNTVGSLSAQDLVARVRTLNAEGNRVVANLLVHLGEMDARELYTKHACSSMFAFCRRLGMSEGSTGRRLASARAIRKFPKLLPLIERGELHLTALAIVSGILTADNVDTVIAAIVGKTQRQVEEVRVRYAPRARVKDLIRKMPELAAPAIAQTDLESPPSMAAMLAQTDLESPPSMAATVAPPEPVTGPPVDVAPAMVTRPARSPALAPAAVTPVPAEPALLGLFTENRAPLLPPAPAVAAAAVRIAKPAPPIVPLQEDAYKVQLTASKALVAKIDHVKAMMMHRNPKGDLATIFDAALDLLIAKLEKERFGKTSRSQRVARPCKAGSVSQDKRREVFERDGYQCTHVDESGHRCEERGWLEIDHIDPKALNGGEDTKNLRIRCRAHNAMHAKDVFGADYIERRIEASKRDRAKARAAKQHPDEQRPDDARTRESLHCGGESGAGKTTPAPRRSRIRGEC